MYQRSKQIDQQGLPNIQLKFVLYLGDKNIGLPILTSYETSYDLDSNIVSDSVVFIQKGINYVKDCQ